MRGPTRHALTLLVTAGSTALGACDRSSEVDDLVAPAERVVQEGQRRSAEVSGGSAISAEALCELLDLSLVGRIGEIRDDYPKAMADQREATCMVTLATENGLRRLSVHALKPKAYGGAKGQALLERSFGAHQVESMAGIGDQAYVTTRNRFGTGIYFRIGDEVLKVKGPADAGSTVKEIAASIAARLGSAFSSTSSPETPARAEIQRLGR